MPKYCSHPSRCPEAHAVRIPDGCSFLMNAIKKHLTLDEIKGFILSAYSLEHDKKGRTIIMYLLKYGIYEDNLDDSSPKKISNEAFCDFLTFLVTEKNQDANTKNHWGFNALNYALIYNYDKCVIECLYNLGAKVDTSHIKCALECRHDQSVLDTLVNLGATVDGSHIMCALECSFSQSRLDTLVKLGGKVDSSHIKYAIELGDYLNKSVLPTLVNLGGKVDSDHIKYALEHRLPLYVLDNLVKLGGEVDSDHIKYVLQHCTPTVQDKLIELRTKNVPRKGRLNI